MYGIFYAFFVTKFRTYVKKHRTYISIWVPTWYFFINRK